MQPWWSETASMWVGAIGGSACGVICGVHGALGGILAPRGIGRRWMLPLHVFLIVVCLVTGAAGIYAIFDGQPRRIWYPLLLLGGIGTVVNLPLYFVLRMRYMQAEMRKMNARDFESESSTGPKNVASGV